MQRLFLLVLFFYPIHDIGLVHPENLPDFTAAYTAVVHFDRQLPRFFWIGKLLRVDRVDDAALLTLAALGSRCITPYFDLVCGLPAFGAFLPCLFCCFSHVPYYIIKYANWTLPCAAPRKSILQKGRV